MEYIVKEGDTLSEILYDATGDGTYENYMKVAAQNNISNPDEIIPGQVIYFDNESGSSESISGPIDEVKINNTIEKGDKTVSSTGDERTSSAKSVDKETITNKSITKDEKEFVSNSGSNESESGKQGKSTSKSEEKSNVSASNISNKVATATSAIGVYSFTSNLEDDDEIQMDISAARQYINDTMDSDLGDMCSKLADLVADLETMQNRQYSASGTKVDQDYLDFEALTEAISDFLVECNKILDDINNYIDSCERTLYN